MKKKLFVIALTIVATCLPSFSQSLISGSLKFLSATTNEEITEIRVGQSFKIKFTETDLHLLANKNVKLSYVLSVVPTGANTPISISGKLEGRATLPSSLGGKTKTKREMASLEGTLSTAGILTVPDFMPEGVATVTLSVSSVGVGSISIDKSINILL